MQRESENRHTPTSPKTYVDACAHQQFSRLCYAAHEQKLLTPFLPNCGAVLSALLSALSLLLSKQSSMFLTCSFLYVWAQGFFQSRRITGNIIHRHILRQDVRRHVCGRSPLQFHRGVFHQIFHHHLIDHGLTSSIQFCASGHKVVWHLSP